MTTPACPYCGEAAELVEAAAVGLDGGGDYVWWCEADKAWAMIHTNSPTHKPVTRLSNKQLHETRRIAVSAFTRLYKTWGASRLSAHQWLADRMNLELADCDFNKFDMSRCLMALLVAETFTPKFGE